MTEHTAVQVEDQPAAHDLAFLEHQINTYNIARVGTYDWCALAIFVRDTDEQIVAGLSGYTWAGLCEVQFLWVHETLRGQGHGMRLLQAAEREARARGCGSIVLGSYSFQAPGFYRKHGFEIVGRANDCPPGYAHYYFQKRLF